MRDPSTFIGHNCTDEVLHDGIARSNKALILQILQGFSQNCDGPCREHGDPPRLAFEFPSSQAIAAPIIKYRKNDLLLFKAYGFGKILD